MQKAGLSDVCDAVEDSHFQLISEMAVKIKGSHGKISGLKLTADKQSESNARLESHQSALYATYQHQSFIYKFA